MNLCRMRQSLGTIASLRVGVFVGMLGFAPVAFAAGKPPEAKPATQYAAFDSHAEEHVSIAAEPCDEPKNCGFFRLEYIQHGFLPVRVIITNDSDKALSLDEVRIQFLSASGDRIPAATDEDINRRLFSTKRAMGTKIPMIPITIHHPPVDRKISEDDADFGFNSTTVQPHTTSAGYLFYDIRDLDDPAMRHASLYLKEIRTLDGKHELFEFTIPFDNWLKAHPDAPSNKERR